MKLKTHAGAKKRLRLKASGKVKYKQKGMRHKLERKSSKRKRQLGVMNSYLDSANMYQAERLLVF